MRPQAADQQCSALGGAENGNDRSLVGIAAGRHRVDLPLHLFNFLVFIGHMTRVVELLNSWTALRPPTQKTSHAVSYLTELC